MAKTDKKAGLLYKCTQHRGIAMHKTVEIQGKRLEISTTKEADAILASRNLPVCVEMELLFDVLLSKKVKFLLFNDDSAHPKGNHDLTVNVNEKLSTRFRPVMMQCDNNMSKQKSGTSEHSHLAEQCHFADFPIKKIKPYIPRWLHIDFRFGHWFGEFGY